MKAEVSYLRDLVPQNLFGHWQRKRYVMTTSAEPGFFPSEDRGLWTISRLNDEIHFLNPDNGLRVRVHVTRVREGTATFVYDSHLSPNAWCREELTLTPGEDRLSGTQWKTCYQTRANGEPVEYFSAQAQVEGIRANRLPPLR